jgi:hypothetical protein
MICEAWLMKNDDDRFMVGGPVCQGQPMGEAQEMAMEMTTGPLKNMSSSIGRMTSHILFIEK